MLNDLLAVNAAAVEPAVPRATPLGDGYYMPAEWMEHVRCWMLWPERSDVWRENALPAQRAYARVAAAIAEFEPVTVGALPEQTSEARQALPSSVEVVSMHYNDAWMRDVGPSFVINQQGSVRGVDWEFNAWGGLYVDFSADQEVADQVLALVDAPRYQADLIMEGGAFHVDGEGTALVVEENLLHVSRNPQLSREQIEERLRSYLGVETVIWLPLGVYEDETDGHVDNLCTFVRPGVVALTWTDDPYDPQFERSAAAKAVLEQARDARGRAIEVHMIHQPGPFYLSHAEAFGLERKGGSFQRLPGQRLAASYVNYYVANGGVVAPIYDDPHDEAALATLEKLYPQRRVVGVPAREILLGGGSVHCITQQQPVAHGELMRRPEISRN